jgi:NAD(P)-dependent dehydrogenase (short-subunit alcohol dehydrogenase family)
LAVATWKTAIVVGASSGIGEAVARRLASDGCRVALVARRENELKAVVESIENVTADGRAIFRVHDVADGEAATGVWDSVERELGPVDLLVFAAGIMPAVGETEFTFALDRAILETNLIGAVAWLDVAALRMATARRGTIVGISSVAGDRGRRGNPVYAASKAAMNSVLESLRNRLGPLGITVCTIRPGYVDTPMTKGLGLPARMTISADTAARLVLAAARKKRGVDVYVPMKWAPIRLSI